MCVGGVFSSCFLTHDAPAAQACSYQTNAQQSKEKEREKKNMGSDLKLRVTASTDAALK